MKYDQILIVKGHQLTKHYIQSLSKQERLDLIDPIFKVLRSQGWIYPDNLAKVKTEWTRLLEYQPDLSSLEVFNNSSLATNICKHFCHKFYLATEVGKPTMLDNFANDDLLKKMIHNRLGLDWLEPDERGVGVNEAFNLSFKMMVQAQRSMRLINQTSMFKPSVAKYLCLKYSQVGDVVYDYSAGWGGRMLGAVACGRKYIGVDPWTTDELGKMVEALHLEGVELIDAGSEEIKRAENSVDFSYSSPPFYSQEMYVLDNRQAYNKGEEYFYGVYWKQTLENVRYMLKPQKWFGLNVTNYPHMVEMAREVFGPEIETVQLRTIRSHLTKKTLGAEKFEPIYMFRNAK